MFRANLNTVRGTLEKLLLAIGIKSDFGLCGIVPDSGDICIIILSIAHEFVCRKDLEHSAN